MTNEKQYCGAPATVEAVIEAVMQLVSTKQSKAEEAVRKKLPDDKQRLDSKIETDTSEDFLSDEELVDASPLPLSNEQHRELINLSFATHRGSASNVVENQSPKTVRNREELLRVLGSLTAGEAMANAAAINNDRTFVKIGSGIPATVEEVLAAIVQLRDIDEVTILEMASDGQMHLLFPFELQSVIAQKTSSPFARPMRELTPAAISEKPRLPPKK